MLIFLAEMVEGDFQLRGSLLPVFNLAIASI
jgi:chemotaxis signal transduction protein